MTLSPTSCVFQDLTTKKLIGSGYKRNGLYYLDLGASPTALSATILTPVALQIVSSFAAKVASSSQLESYFDLAFKACQLGKHHRGSFPCSLDNHQSSPYIVDIDI